MQPLDWNLVFRVPLDEDEDDDSIYEGLYEQILEFDTKEPVDSTQLQRLFDVTRHIMKMKAIQAEVALEELEKAELGSEHNRELLEQVAELRERLRKADNGDSGITGSDIEQLEAQLKLARAQLQQKELELEQEKHTLEKYVALHTEAENENKSLKIEVTNLQAELQDKFRQLERYESAIEASHLESESKLTSKLKERNKQISQLLSDIQDSEREKQLLKEKIDVLKSNLLQASQQMDETTDSFVEMKESFQGLKTTNEGLLKENHRLKEQISHVTDDLASKDKEMAKLAETYNEDYVRLNEIISRQNQEIARLREENESNKATVEELRLSNEQSAVNILRRALEDRNQQVEQLKKYLEQATRDIEENAAITESLRHQLQQQRDDGTGVTFKKPSRWLDIQQKLREKALQLKSTQDMLSRAEEEGRQKDKQLTDVLATMKKYEMGEYGLSDAVAEIKEYKKQVQIRDREIEALTQQLNRLETEVEEVSEENTTLRERLHEDPDARLSPISVRGPERTKKLQAEIARLEDENIDLKHKLHRASKEKSTRLSASTPPKSARKRRKEKATQVSPAEESPVRTALPPAFEKDKSNEQLLELEEENRDLRLGMEEILRSIQEQNEISDVVIQCPALERLVRVIRKRSGHDSEGDDSLREENRRLKTELKTLKRRYLSMKEKWEADRLQKLSENRGISEDVQTVSAATSPIPSEWQSSKMQITGILEDSAATDETKMSCQKLLRLPDNVEDMLRGCTSLGELYRQFCAERAALRSVIEGYEEEKLTLVEQMARAKVVAERYQEELKTLPLDVAARETETEQLRIEKEVLCRHCNLLKSTVSLLKKELARERVQSLVKDDVILEQLDRLESKEEIASLRIQSLQGYLEDCIPKEAFQSVADQFFNLSSKFKVILDQFDKSETLNYSSKINLTDGTTSWAEVPLSADDHKSLKTIAELSARCCQLQEEASSYKSRLQSSRSEERNMEQENLLLKKENAHLQELVRNIQSQDEEQAKNGELYQQLLAAQMAETAMVQETEHLKTVLEGLHSKYIALEKRYQEKDDALLKAKLNYHVHVQDLTKIVKELRFQYQGLVPIERQAKLLSIIAQLKATKGFSNSPDVGQSTTTTNSEDAEPTGTPAPQPSLEDALSFFENRLTEVETENIRLQQEVHSKQLLVEERDMDLETVRKELQYIRETSGNVPLEGNDEVIRSLKCEEGAHFDTKQKLKSLQKELTETQKDLKIATNSLQAKDKIIEELKSVIPTDASGKYTVCTEYYKLKRSLNVAMATARSFQALLKQKESTLTRYRELVSSLRQEVASEKSRCGSQVYAVEHDLVAKHEGSIQNLKGATAQLFEPPERHSSATIEHLREISKLEKALAERSRIASAAAEEVRAKEKQLASMQDEMNELRRLVATGPQRADTSSHKEDTLAQLQEELFEKQQALTEKEEEIQRLRDLVASAQATESHGPDRDLIHQIQKLKGLVDEKEKQLQALSKALIDLRSEMMTTIESTLARPTHKQRQLGNEEDVVALKETISSLEMKMAHLKSDMKASAERELFLNDEVRLMKEENEKIKSSLSKASQEKQRLLKTIERLKKMPTRKTSRQSGGSEEAALLQRELMVLRESLKNVQNQDKSQDLQDQTAKSSIEVARWEERKKWTATVEKLKAQLQEASQKLEASNKTTAITRAQAYRLEQQRNALELKMKQLRAAKTASNDAEEQLSMVASLQRRIAELESQGSTSDTHVQTPQLREQNRLLREKVQRLERQLVHKDVFRKVTPSSRKKNDFCTTEQPAKFQGDGDTWNVSEKAEVIVKDKMSMTDDTITVAAVDTSSQQSELEKYKSQVGILRITVDRLQDELDRLSKDDHASKKTVPRPASL